MSGVTTAKWLAMAQQTVSASFKEKQAVGASFQEV